MTKKENEEYQNEAPCTNSVFFAPNGHLQETGVARLTPVRMAMGSEGAAEL